MGKKIKKCHRCKNEIKVGIPFVSLLCEIKNSWAEGSGELLICWDCLNKYYAKYKKYLEPEGYGFWLKERMLKKMEGRK